MPEPKTEAAAVFGARVRERRHELELSQEGVAERAGLSWSFVSQVERGQRNLTLQNIVKIAAGLDIDPGLLITGLTPATPPNR